MTAVIEFFTSLGSTIFSSLDLIGVYVILALGLNLINGMAGMFSIGHAGFWAVGAYTAAVHPVAGDLGPKHHRSDCGDWYSWASAGLAVLALGG